MCSATQQPRQAVLVNEQLPKVKSALFAKKHFEQLGLLPCTRRARQFAHQSAVAFLTLGLLLSPVSDADPS